MTGPDPRAAVRVAQLERTLENFNGEIGNKVALSMATALARYDEEVAGPRATIHERRLAILAVCVAAALLAQCLAVLGLTTGKVALVYLSWPLLLVAWGGACWLLWGYLRRKRAQR